jgi:hypothetical protein
VTPDSQRHGEAQRPIHAGLFSDRLEAYPTAVATNFQFVEFCSLKPDSQRHGEAQRPIHAGLFSDRLEAYPTAVATNFQFVESWCDTGLPTARRGPAFVPKVTGEFDRAFGPSATSNHRQVGNLSYDLPVNGKAPRAKRLSRLSSALCQSREIRE